MARKRGGKLKLLIRIVMILAILFLIAPREPVDREIAFDPAAIGPYPQVYLRRAEEAFPDLTPGTEKRIVWAGATGAVTPISVVYVHGFSATSEEIRPVPDQLANALGANLHFTRLTGHGRPGDALAEATAGDWIEDYAEALAVGRRIGREVIVVATSTGGTLAALAATDSGQSDGVKGLILVSPNFALQHAAAFLLDWPYARYWVPLLAGTERNFEAQNAAHANFWTTRYPSTAVFPMAALVGLTTKQDFRAATIPALFLYSEADQAVSPAATKKVAAAWGGPVRLEARVMGEGDDPYSHVIVGDTLSPSQTDAAVALMTEWARGL